MQVYENAKKDIIKSNDQKSVDSRTKGAKGRDELAKRRKTERIKGNSERVKRDISKLGDVFAKERYEAILAHCLCASHEMECIWDYLRPENNNSVCVCQFDNERMEAWPCYNVTEWYNTRCSECSVDGICEYGMPEGTPTALNSDQCICQNQSMDDQLPFCVKGDNQRLRKIWEFKETTTSASTTTMTTTITTTTKPPATTEPSRVTKNETKQAMGYQGMTDGVAMLTKAKENLIFAMSSLNESQRAYLSHKKEDFIEMCSFNGKQCNINVDFKQHVDPEFGNCYTFNWDKNNSHMSSKAGPMYGIRVLLFVDKEDYMTTSESVGVRVAVHSPTEYPFPDTFGYSAPVGFASSFGLKKQVVQRLSAPYGDCEKQKIVNTSRNIYQGYDYNPEGCHRSCFQNSLIDKCGCGDPRFPVPEGYEHCDGFNATARGCLERAILEIGDFHHSEDPNCYCKQPCNHDIYSVTFSAAKWPSGTTDLGNCGNRSVSDCEEFYGLNAALVEVYYEQLNYELLKESEAYGLVNLLADVGGHLGLWMGFSVITIIECGVLFFDLITLCCKQRREKKEMRRQATTLRHLEEQRQSVESELKQKQRNSSFDRKSEEKMFEI